MDARPPRVARRQVVAGVGTVGALATAATLLPIGRTNVINTEPASSATPPQGSGYRLSEHVLRYYQTTRL